MSLSTSRSCTLTLLYAFSQRTLDGEQGGGPSSKKLSKIKQKDQQVQRDKFQKDGRHESISKLNQSPESCSQRVGSHFLKSVLKQHFNALIKIQTGFTCASLVLPNYSLSCPFSPNTKELHRRVLLVHQQVHNPSLSSHQLTLQIVLTGIQNQPDRAPF